MHVLYALRTIQNPTMSVHWHSYSAFSCRILSKSIELWYQSTKSHPSGGYQPTHVHCTVARSAKSLSVGPLGPNYFKRAINRKYCSLAAFKMFGKKSDCPFKALFNTLKTIAWAVDFESFFNWFAIFLSARNHSRFYMARPLLLLFDAHKFENEKWVLKKVPLKDGMVNALELASFLINSRVFWPAEYDPSKNTKQ